jgi:hypothetical protein
MKSIVFLCASIFLLVSCERPKEPQNNFIEINFHSFDKAFWNEAPEKVSFSLSVGNNLEYKSPKFTILRTSEEVYQNTSQIAWKLNYLDLEKLGQNLKFKIFTNDIDPSFLSILDRELANKIIDFESIPISAPVIITLQDNPSATRSFKEATGAKLKFKIQRKFVENSSVDIPSATSLCGLSETWWTSINSKKLASYEEYREYYFVSKMLVEQSFGKGTFRAQDVVGKKTKAELADLRNKIQKYVKQKIRRQIKLKILASLNNKIEDYDSSKAELFWDYMNHDSSTSVFTKYVVKSSSKTLNNLMFNASESKAGTFVKSIIENEIAQDQVELDTFYNESKLALNKGLEIPASIKD